jgi:hypothetical protein
MDVIEADQVVWVVCAAAGIALLSAALAISVRTRKIHERLLELGALERSIRRLERNVGDTEQVVDRLSDVLPGLSGLGLHFRQIKRDQFRLSEKVTAVAADAFNGLLELRRDFKKRDEQIIEIAEGSRALQQWRAGVRAAYADASRHLFESEPIRELIGHFGSQAGSTPLDLPERGKNPRRQAIARSRRPR